MVDEGFDLESSWKAVRPQFQEDSRPDFFQRTLFTARERTIVRISKEFRDKTLSGGDIAKFVCRGVQVFIEEWYQSLRDQDKAGLVEAILDGQNLTPSEMRGFVRALPLTFLVKVSESAMAGASGVHALLAVEFNRRNGIVREYDIDRVGDRLQVSVKPTNDRPFQFFLDDDFEVDAPADKEELTDD